MYEYVEETTRQVISVWFSFLKSWSRADNKNAAQWL